MPCLSRYSIAPVAIALLLAVPGAAQSATAAAVSITVTASANPSTYGSPVAFTVAVAAPTTAGPVPTGTVTATLLGPIFLGSATLDSAGRAVITVPAGPSALATSPFGLPAGSDSITFVYSGDSKYKSAQTTATQFVNKANTTTTAAIVGSAQPLHLTATVSIDEATAAASPFSPPGNATSSAPTGPVQFFNGTTSLGTAQLTPSGLFTSTATLTVVTVPATLTAVYGGDNNYNGSTSATVTGGGGKGMVGLTVTSGVNPSTFAEPVTFTIAVAPSASGGASPTGTVTASLLGLFTLGSAPVSGGQASITVPGLATSAISWGFPAGSNNVTFSYGGDANYSAAQTNFTQIVDKAATATTATIANATITAVVNISEPSVSSAPFALPGAQAGATSPTGNIQFLNGNTVIGMAPLSPSGQYQSTASLPIAQPLASTADIVAVYAGDADYNGSTSPPATVPTLGAVTIGVSSSVNPATFAEPVSFTITVAPSARGNVIPTGSVQLTVFGDNLPGGPLDVSGSLTVVVPPQNPAAASPAVPFGLATGSNVITVSYSGDANFAPGQTTFNQMVTQADSSTRLLFAPSAAGSETVMADVSIDEASVSQTNFQIPTPGNLSTSPSGNVDFFDGSTLLGSVKLTPGSLFQASATFTATPPPSSIRAVYYGDVNYTGSSSPSSGSGNGTATVTLTSSNNPTAYGAAFTIQATVASATAGGPTPTGSVQFFDGTQSLGGPITVDSSGHANLAIPIPLATPLVCAITCPPAANVLVLGAGPHSITAQYSGDVNYASATSATALAEQITKAPTNTSVAAAVLDPPGVGAELFATVADAQPPSGGPYRFMAMTASGVVEGDPTGTVTFYGGATSIGTGTLTPNSAANVASTATLSPGSTSAGNYSASYPGDANFQGSSSPTPTPTSVTLSGSPNPSNTGQSVTLTAAIVTTSTAPAPTGKVTFLEGATPIGSMTLSGSTATVTVTFSTSGSHSLTAAYSGDANYGASTSPVYTQVVNGSTIPSDTLSLMASITTAVYGQHIVLFAQLSGNISTPPTGTVNFLDGASSIGTGTLQGGAAFLLTTLGVGTHSISAQWAGNASWPAAQSTVVTITVNRAATHTSLTSFDGVWTAGVVANAPGEGTPTGSVQFVDTVTQAVLATVTLNGGFASASLTTGGDKVEAVYSGDGNFLPGNSHVAATVAGPRR